MHNIMRRFALWLALLTFAVQPVLVQAQGIDPAARGLAIQAKNDTRPIRINPIFAGFGDSVWDYGSTSCCKTVNGLQHWIQVFTGYRVTFPNAIDFAVAGTTCDQVLASAQAGQVDQAVAAGASGAVLMCASNDRGANFPASQTMAAINNWISLVRSRGLLAVVFVQMGRGSATYGQTLSAAQLGAQMNVRQQIRNLHSPKNGIYVIDMTPFTDAPLSTTGYNNDARTRDGVHPNQVGAYLAGQGAANTFMQMFPPIQIEPRTNSDIYDATNNPRGSLTGNPMLDGTAGTINTSTCTGTTSGQVASTWTIGCMAQTAAMTITASKVSKADGTVCQQIQFSGTPTVSGTTVPYISFYRSIGLSGAPAGTNVTVTGRVEWDADVSNLLSVAVGSEASYGSGGLAQSYAGVPPVNGYSTSPALVQAVSFVEASDPMTVPVGVTSDTAKGQIYLNPGVAASGTVRFCSMMARVAN